MTGGDSDTAGTTTGGGGGGTTADTTDGDSATESDTAGADDGGCNCRADGPGDLGGGLLSLIGLGLLGRSRRRR